MVRVLRVVHMAREVPEVLVVCEVPVVPVEDKVSVVDKATRGTRDTCCSVPMVLAVRQGFSYGNFTDDSVQGRLPIIR